LACDGTINGIPNVTAMERLLLRILRLGNVRIPSLEHLVHLIKVRHSKSGCRESGVRQKESDGGGLAKMVTFLLYALE
jgi:hypothetical protein